VIEYKSSSVIAAVGFLILNSPLTGQATDLEVSERPSCESCRVEITPIVQLGSSDDPAGFGSVAELAINSQHQYAVSSNTFPGEIFWYDVDGRFVDAFGRRGGGPGEFNSDLLLSFDAHDSLHVIEKGGFRYTVMTPNLGYERSARLEGRVFDFCLEAGGNLFAAASIVKDGGVSFGQVFSGQGQTVRSFAVVDQLRIDPITMPQHVACDARGRRWIASRLSYVIEAWTPSGKLDRRFSAKRSWFLTPEVGASPSGRARQPGPAGSDGVSTQLTGITVDSAHRLWVFAEVQGTNGQTPGTGGPSTTHTVIEVLDSNSGALLATATVAGSLRPSSEGRAYSLVEDAFGDRRIQIWRLRFRDN
jgi:hypothetical protein